MDTKRLRIAQSYALILIGLLFGVIYLNTLQTIPNGSDHYYMIDVGETQVVLNMWGTLHATGYPHYVILSSALVTILKVFGISAAAAPAVTSLIWGIASLGLFYLLLMRTTELFSAMIAMLLFGLTRTVWIHHVIAEIYTFGLLLLIALYWLALRSDAQKDSVKAIYWLAFIGGIGVAHHRAIAMAIPALLYAVYPILRAQGRKLPRVLIISLLLGLIGFVPYLYLMLRAQAGAAWVYGEPETFAGLWDQFIGREASRFIGGVSSLDGLLDNFRMVTEVLLTDMTPVGVIFGVIGLYLGVRHLTTRRAAIMMILGGGAAYLFHVVFYTDILSALILAVEVSLAAGWAFGITWVGEALIAQVGRLKVKPPEGQYVLAWLMAIFLVPVLVSRNQDFIYALTHDQTGVETRDTLLYAPPDSTLMIAWGPRHFAAGFWRDVEGIRPDVTLIDHKADFQAALENGALVTPDYTFYQFPLEWWEGQLGGRVSLNAAAPRLIALSTTPQSLGGAHWPDGLPFRRDEALSCDQSALTVTWGGFGVNNQTRAGVERYDLSVFVHLLDANGNIIAQADQSAPVYGWYPFTRWASDEQVTDIYPFESLQGGALIRYGLYTQAQDGSFVNVREYEIPVECER